MAAAPGRVNLIGEHVDYNGGFVLPMAIERYTVIAAAPAEKGTVPFCSATSEALVPATKEDGPRRVAAEPANRTAEVRLASADLHEDASFTLDGKLSPGKPAWANYVRGVVAGCTLRGFSVPGFDAVISSNVPIGGGLSSSAALEVAVATLLEAMVGQTIDPTAKALLCQMAEHEFAGVPCGIMDQFIAVGAKQGHAMLLDCRSMQSELVPFTNPDVTVLIINSQVRHSLAAGEYAKRRAECHAAAETLQVAALRDVTIEDLHRRRDDLDPTVFRRARHVVDEIERTKAAAHAIGHDDWMAVGAAMYASHESLRDDYEVSCDELNLLVDLAAALGPKQGVIGSRMTGGGFGGCTVSLVRTDAVENVSRSIGEAYRQRTGIEAAMFATRPAGGARVLTV